MTAYIHVHLKYMTLLCNTSKVHVRFTPLYSLAMLTKTWYALFHVVDLVHDHETIPLTPPFKCGYIPVMLTGLSICDTCLMACGPCLVPERLEQPISRGMPMKQASRPSGWASWRGSRIMVGTPANLHGGNTDIWRDRHTSFSWARRIFSRRGWANPKLYAAYYSLDISIGPWFQMVIHSLT